MLSGSDDDGVIGYQATMVTPANMQPRAAAEFPSMMILPAVLSARWMKYGSRLDRVAAACSYRACPAAGFRLAAFTLLENCLRMAFSTSAMSICSNWATTPT